MDICVNSRGGVMYRRLLLSTVILLVASVPMLAQTPQSAIPQPASSPPASWSPPKTPWGDPDLQGIYTSDDYINVGLQRAANFGTRLYLTDEEIAAREATVRAAEQNSLREFAAPNANVGTGPPGHWGERARRAPRQTSLIVEPEDGRMPALTDEGRARQLAASNRQGATSARPADSWEDYTYYIRWI